MAEHDKILTHLLLPTHQLKMELLQDIMNKGREHSKLNNKPDKDFWDQISEILWKHLKTGFKKFDDQLLCATSFYTVISFSNKPDYYLDEVLHVLEQELFSKNSDNVQVSKTALAVCIMYGLFQSPFLALRKETDIKILYKLLRSTFNLLVQMGYEYTQYTFVVFKTIRTFKKVCGTELQQCIFDKDNQISLLNLVNHNWENPITGIRDQIRSIFQTLISTVDEEMYKKILEEINSFYWNKAKYLMFSEIIEYANEIPKVISVKGLVNGLIYSLHKPGLVSAGADMYYAVLKIIQSEQNWCDIFLDSVMEVLKEPSIKPMENFSNYWCLTTFKAFPKILNIILDEVACNQKNFDLMFNCLCIMKQGNKLGLLDNNSNRKLMITQGLEDNSPRNRMLAFDIVCVNHGKILPRELDYQLIIHFLHDNINTDCTVLRLSMIGSITYFLTELHVLFLNNIKNDEDVYIQEVLNYCKNFQELIIASLSLNGNYQRKITGVKLCTVFITALCEVHRKKRDQTRQAKKSLMEFLNEKKYWLLSKQDFVMKLLSLVRDPADDVRDSAIKLLLKHYSSIIKDTTILNHLIENALKSMRSKFFYEINCGQAMFKLICNLLFKGNVEDATFKNIDDIFNFAHRELLREHKLQRNVMESIENGKQMHSFINILCVLIETCILNSTTLRKLDDFVHDLLDILEDVTNQFSWDKENSSSSDFSQMNDMVQDIIIKSGYNPFDCNDQTKISGLHQIVLNCLWLNVKASCDLAALLIQYYTDDVEVCRKCLNLITHVLETSRHKGVIEAAGVALGKGVQHLTLVSENCEISELPMILLNTKLNEMISDANKMSSITRRGAGLSIMVHRIVSSDVRRDKPLFHYFMRTLLKICSEIANVPIMMEDQNFENQIDLPKAINIHFLTRIVTDSSLASDMMYYSTELSALAFSELTNPHWQIRNAALQLYGALVPKLVGQKKPAGAGDDTIATVACDELRKHSPKLWSYIIEMLQKREYTDLLLTHSNFVPILNMLANSAKRYKFSHDSDPIIWEKQLLQSLLALLGSPIFTVRRLTAKCIFNIYSFDDIFNSVINLKYSTENLLHGTLVLVEISHKYYSSKYPKQFQTLQGKLSKMLASGNHCYPSREIYENVFCNVDLDQKEIVKTLLEAENNKLAPGIFVWGQNRIRKYILKSSWKEIPTILKIILKQSDFEKYCVFVSEKLEVNKRISETILKEITKILIAFKNSKSSCIIWKILYNISLKFDSSSYIDAANLLKKFNNENAYKLRYMIPLIATVLSNAAECIQIQFTRLVSSLSNPDKADVDMRYIAVIANNEVAKIFYKLDDSVRIIAIKTAIVFLQDEDDDLRCLSVHFYKNLIKAQRVMQAYICLNKILDPEFLAPLFDKPKVAIKNLCIDLDEIIVSNMSGTVDKYNPFSSDAKNIYLEAEVLKEFILKLNNTDL